MGAVGGDEEKGRRGVWLEKSLERRGERVRGFLIVRKRKRILD